MLKKIISIKNIGRFRNSAASGNGELSRYTLIVGANGFGKSTLCAVLRSLKTSNPAHIIGRRTLGIKDPPTVELLFPNGTKRFDGATWTAPHSDLHIFDGVFVTENVHSGEAVEIDHRRNLFRIIIGEKGVRMAKEDTELAGQSRQKTSEITTVAKAIQPHIPAGMALNGFLALPTDPEIDTRITEQERNVEAVRRAQQINERAPLSEITVPSLPESLADLLARTIDDIAQDAETHLNKHLMAHSMGTDGGNWIAEGLEHADGESCPFCGQDIRALPLITAYRAVFSERYKALRGEITVMRTQIAKLFGESAIAHLNTRIEQNKSASEFWGQYCTFDQTLLTVPNNIRDAIHMLGQAAMALLDCKGRAPLEPIQPDDAFNAATTIYESARTKVQQITHEIQTVNALIDAKKKEAGATDIQAAKAELARLQAVKVRHGNPVAGLCTEYVRLTKDKDDIDQRKNDIREQLKAHTMSVVKPYEQRINHYLDSFNAGFLITETKHGYPGGTAASTYQIVINDTAIDLGDGGTPTDRPSFKNTLSSGDRTTLALAFFLAHLEQDQDLSAKTVVFDDPFSSQDAFRRRQTVHEIAQVGRKCAQVIILSHDSTFLKQVWDKAPVAERVSLTLADHRAQGIKIMPVDLERACQGRTAKDIDDLQNYVTTGTGEPLDLIRKMRAVLEAHCWITYPAYFQTGQDWLGEIVQKIREHGDTHPAHALYDELDQINDYTKEHHHGEDMADTTPDQIDSQELTGYIKRTLRIVNALPSLMPALPSGAGTLPVDFAVYGAALSAPASAPHRSLCLA